jgi:hypothetical protein
VEAHPCLAQSVASKVDLTALAFDSQPLGLILSARLIKRIERYFTRAPFGPHVSRGLQQTERFTQILICKQLVEGKVLLLMVRIARRQVQGDVLDPSIERRSAKDNGVERGRKEESNL